MSPGGLSYIGHSLEQLGEIPGAVAIKRIILDHAIVKAACRLAEFHTCVYSCC